MRKRRTRRFDDSPPSSYLDKRKYKLTKKKKYIENIDRDLFTSFIGYFRLNNSKRKINN